MSNQFVIARDGLPPLSFAGKVIAQPVVESVGKRFYFVTFFERDDGMFVLGIRFESDWNKEFPCQWAFIGKDSLDFTLQLRDFNPVPPAVGYPPDERYAWKQQQLEYQLKNAFNAALSQAYFDSNLVSEF